MVGILFFIVHITQLNKISTVYSMPLYRDEDAQICLNSAANMTTTFYTYNTILHINCTKAIKCLKACFFVLFFPPTNKISNQKDLQKGHLTMRGQKTSKVMFVS